MAIENRDLAVGTKLVASHKKQTYRAEVVHTEEGIRYELEDGRAFTSLSAAGMAITRGNVNGWRFWSVESVGAEPTVPQVAADKPKRSNGVIQRVPNQKGVPEGQVRCLCVAFLDSFYVEAGGSPTTCPKGHDDSFGQIQVEVGESQVGDSGLLWGLLLSLWLEARPFSRAHYDFMVVEAAPGCTAGKLLNGAALAAR